MPTDIVTVLIHFLDDGLVQNLRRSLELLRVLMVDLNGGLGALLNQIDVGLISLEVSVVLPKQKKYILL